MLSCQILHWYVTGVKKQNKKLCHLLHFIGCRSSCEYSVKTVAATNWCKQIQAAPNTCSSLDLSLNIDSLLFAWPSLCRFSQKPALKCQRFVILYVHRTLSGSWDILYCFNDLHLRMCVKSFFQVGAKWKLTFTWSCFLTSFFFREQFSQQVTMIRSSLEILERQAGNKRNYFYPC